MSRLYFFYERLKHFFYVNILWLTHRERDLAITQLNLQKNIFKIINQGLWQLSNTDELTIMKFLQGTKITRK